MKTLIIADVYPLPENSGGSIRTMNFARFFKKFGDVDIVYFKQADKGVDVGPPFNGTFYVDKYEGDYNQNGLHELIDKFKYFKPWALSHFSNQCINRVVEIIEQDNYDFILCRYAHHAFPLFFLSDKSRKGIIVDIDDLMSRDLYETIHGKQTGLIKLKCLIDILFYQLYQMKCATLGKSLICSEVDKIKLGKFINKENIFIVPNVAPELDVSHGFNKNGHCNIGTILFVGNLVYRPNVEGLKWFIAEIFERLIRDDNQIRLIVAGKDPDPEVRILCNKHNQIELVESPPDIVPYYDQCGAVIVPLLTGGGTRIKILEAGHALRPIISTKIGAYGLDLIDYDNVLYMDDYNTFVERYHWLKDINNYDNIVTNMNNFVETNFTIKKFDSLMNNIIIK